MPSLIPVWLSNLAEATAQKRFNDLAVLEPVPPDEFLHLMHQLADNTATDDWSRWGKWFSSDELTRMVSPFVDTTTIDYFNNQVEEGTSPSLREATRISPTNGIALARLARRLLQKGESEENSNQVAQANWYSRQALKFSPREPEALWAQAEVLARSGNLTNALAAIKDALAIQPQHPELWEAQGRFLQNVHRDGEAYQSLTRAITLAENQPAFSAKIKAKLYLSRASFLRGQGRLNESSYDSSMADSLLKRNVPRRDPRAKLQQLDLTPYYNASLSDRWHAGAPTSLDSLPRGLQTLAGVEFDVRGLIQVGAASTSGEKYPEHILDILVGQKCKRLHFLHSAINAFDSRDGVQTGSYVIHYVDGQERTIPIIIGRDLADWWDQPNEQDKPFVVAWSGTNDLARQLKRHVRLFMSTWQNPLPDVPIKSFDFVCLTVEPNPFLVAITTE
jgi:tetratricopeptide (TPR) repeat protein